MSVNWAKRLRAIRSEFLHFHRENDVVRYTQCSQLKQPNPLSCLQKTGCIELSNSHGRNALTGKMMAELSSIIESLENEKYKTLTSVLVYGKNGFFCSGADLTTVRKHLQTKEDGKKMNLLMGDAMTQLKRLPLVSVALIEGAAVGGGAELAVACDYRIMREDAFIHFVHAHMGLSSGWSGGTHLTNLVGRRNALDIMGKSIRMNAALCKEKGLIDVICSKSDDIRDIAAQFLQPFERLPFPETLHAAKRVIIATEELPFKDARKIEDDIYYSLWKGPANIAALRGHIKPTE